MLVEMSREYLNHPVLRRICELADEAILHDTELDFHPVLHKMLCGSFIESNQKKLDIQDADGKAFGKAMDMWCGKLNNAEMALDEVRELAIVADRFQMTEVTSALDEAVLDYLSVGICSDVLNWSGELGLHQAELAAWTMAKERFDELAQTEGFIRMGEEWLGRVLEDDNLASRNEEAVWEAVTLWRGAEEGQARGRGLVGKIRFPLMEEGYLRSRVVGMAPAEDAEWMEAVVAEALRAKAMRAEGATFEFELLGPKALDHRVGLGVRWWEYADGGERRLKGHAEDVQAIAECKGRVCSGSFDGSILVWSTTGEAERTIVPEVESDGVYSLSVWEGHLISGHGSGHLRMWDVATGTCDQVLEGHTDVVHALAVCGPRLASGSEDTSIKVWAMGAAGRCTCERTLLGHTGPVRSLAGWQGKVVSGSDDKSIRVWDVGTGAHDATLSGHERDVCALAVHGRRLYSASGEGIRVWALGTWMALRAVEASCPMCLAVSGSQLVSGSQIEQVVEVWDLETLDLQHTLPLPESEDDGAVVLLAVEGGLWAGVGSDVAVWGRGA